MEENQNIGDPLQDLYNEFNPKLKLAKDYNEFKSIMQDPSNRKAFFDEFNPKLKLAKDYNEFDSVLGLKKKELSLPSGEISSLTQLPSEFTNVLKKGIEPPKPSKEVVSSGLIVPTNLPKQEAASYERELKVNDAALNTLTDIYKQKGLKFDPSKPAAQKQIQEYVDKEKNNDLVRVTGKDGKEYLTRGQGFGEAALKTLGRSLKDPIESAQINFTNNASDLADLLDAKYAEEPNVPESAPSKFGGYLGGLVGGLPKMAALLAIPYAGESAMVMEMYHNAMANQRRELYQKGLEQGMTREQAAKKAMETAPTTAIPDAVLGYAMAKGVGTGGMKAAEQVGKNILPEAAKKSFIDATGKLTKEVGAMSGLGFGGEIGRGLLTKQAGYNITKDEILQKGLSGASEWGLMHAAFKLMHIAPKAISAAAKNLLSHVPEPILKAEAENYPDGQQTLQDVAKFADTKTKVADFVPESKVAAIAGLTEKTDNLKKDIEALEQNKKAVPPAVATEIDNQIKDKNKEVEFYDKQIKKVIDSKSETGVDEEVDDITGKKLGTKTYIVDGKEVSQAEFETMQGKPVGTKEIIAAEVKPEEIKVTETKRIVEPSKPISEMNSEELGNFATETKKALKKQDKYFEGKTEKEKEDGGYYDVIDEVEDLRDASERANFIENAENINDLANSVKSTLSNIKGKEPNEYQLAILNAAKNKAIELNIDTKDLIKNIGSKIANQFKDVEDVELMVKSSLEKLIPTKEIKPTEAKNAQSEVENIANKLSKNEFLTGTHILPLEGLDPEFSEATKAKVLSRKSRTPEAPIRLGFRDGKVTILDGAHRYYEAVERGDKTIKANFAYGEGADKFYDKIKEVKPTEIKKPIELKNITPENIEDKLKHVEFEVTDPENGKDIHHGSDVYKTGNRIIRNGVDVDTYVINGRNKNNYFEFIINDKGEIEPLHDDEVKIKQLPESEMSVKDTAKKLKDIADSRQPKGKIDEKTYQLYNDVEKMIGHGKNGFDYSKNKWEDVAKFYHKALIDGSNPELVKMVDDYLKGSYTPKEPKIYNAKDLKKNPKILEEDEDYHTLTYPRSFVSLSTDMFSMKNNGYENAKIGDIINVFKKDYVVEGFGENKKNPDKTIVRLYRVDKDGNLLRERDLSFKEREAGLAKEGEEEEIQVEKPELTKDDLKKAEAKFAAAEDKFKKARNKIEATQVKQAGMFGGEQKGMFAMGGEEAKKTLEPLRKAAKEAKAELDDIRNRIKVQEQAQPELAPVENKSDEEFVDNKMKIIKNQGKPLSEFKVGDKISWASDYDKRWKQYAEGEIVKAGNEYEIKRFSEHPESKRFKTFRLSSDTNVILKPSGEANYTGEENIAKKKTYQEALKEKQQEEKKRNREIGSEKAVRTKEIFRKLSQTERQLGTDEVGAQEIALRYLADGGMVSKDAIDEAYGRVKRAELNVARREVKSSEVAARDYVGGNETLDGLAHRLWEANEQRVPEDLIKNALMAEIGNSNTRLDAAEAYLENYNEEYKNEKHYARIAEEHEAEHLAAQEQLEKELRSELNKEIEGLSSEEHINNLIDQYESETKGQNKQLRPEVEGEVGKEIGGGNGGEKAKAEEKGIEDVTRIEKRKIINSKFEELLNNEDFYNKFKIKSKCL